MKSLLNFVLLFSIACWSILFLFWASDMPIIGVSRLKQ